MLKRFLVLLAFGLLLGFAACLSPSSDNSSGSSHSSSSQPSSQSSSSDESSSSSDASSSSDSSSSDASASSESSTPIIPGETVCTELVDGQPAGLACIQCLHPNAHAQAMELAQAMRDSCRRALVTNILVNGRFGNDDQFLGQLLNFLATDRNLTVVLYLSNGASQRQGDPARPGDFGSGISVNAFRSRMVNEVALREQYRQIVERMLAIKLNLPENVQFILVPGLEDNFTDAVFDNVLALTREVAGDKVLYGRSACPGCADGNGENIPGGVMPEIHSPAFRDVPSHGVLCTDHTVYHFSFQPPSGEVGIDDLAGLRDAAFGQGTRFILWTAEYQGLPVTNGEISGRPDPDNRVYPSPTLQEYDELVSFLR